MRLKRRDVRFRLLAHVVPRGWLTVCVTTRARTIAPLPRTPEDLARGYASVAPSSTRLRRDRADVRAHSSDAATDMRGHPRSSHGYAIALASRDVEFDHRCDHLLCAAHISRRRWPRASSPVPVTPRAPQSDRPHARPHPASTPSRPRRRPRSRSSALDVRPHERSMPGSLPGERSRLTRGTTADRSRLGRSTSATESGIPAIRPVPKTATD